MLHQHTCQPSLRATHLSHKLPPSKKIASFVRALFLTSGFAVMALTYTGLANAAEPKPAHYNVPAGNLEDALNAFAKQSGVTSTFDPAIVRGKSVNAINGEFTQQQVLNGLLKGTGLEPVTRDGAIVVQSIPARSELLEEVVVRSTKETSHKGLSAPFAGGQVAKASRVGILGNVDIFDTPFSTQSFTDEFALDQQARRVADIIAVDPSVRSAMAEYGDR